MNAETSIRPEHKNLATALAAAQAEMGAALKTASNPHFKTKYADLDSVRDACMPALNKHGISVIQPPFDDDTGRYVKTVFMHGASGESVECRVPLILGKNDMQGYGSAVTYARRYGLMCMAGIAPDDDDGNAAVAAAPKTAQRPLSQQAAPASPSQSAIAWLNGAADFETLRTRWAKLGNEKPDVAADPDVEAAFKARAAQLDPFPGDAVETHPDIADDALPY